MLATNLPNQAWICWVHMFSQLVPETHPWKSPWSYSSHCHVSLRPLKWLEAWDPLKDENSGRMGISIPFNQVYSKETPADLQSIRCLKKVYERIPSSFRCLRAEVGLGSPWTSLLYPPETPAKLSTNLAIYIYKYIHIYIYTHIYIHIYIYGGFRK
jgi:hypothetical protein